MNQKKLILNKVLDIIGKLFKSEELNVYCFATEYHKYLIEEPDISFFLQGKVLKTKHLSNISSWYEYENIYGRQSSEDIINLLQQNQAKISNLRGHSVISYLSNSKHYAQSKIDISKEDIAYISSVISSIDSNVKEVDFIIDSLGGNILTARNIIDLLRNRFEKVNFLIPLTAYSAASMMCMSADEIIMTPESSLSPFDVKLESPDTGKLLPVNVLLKCAREAKRAHNPYCIFIPKSLYKNWNREMSESTIQSCRVSSSFVRHQPTYWLMKYMFKSFTTNNRNFDKYFILPLWKTFSSKGRIANRIVKFFIKTGIQFSHEAPIMYSDLEHSGLNIGLADNELLELLRENSLLSKRLFERSSLYKIYTNQETSLYTFESKNNSLKE